MRERGERWGWEFLDYVMAILSKAIAGTYYNTLTKSKL
jgi:hypothetical protein